MFSAATMDHFPKLYVARVLFGKGSILPIPDIDRCDYFLCLGGNPVVSQGSLMSAPGVRKKLQAIQGRGGRVVVVDPRRTETAAMADEHLFIRPGSDASKLRYAMVAFGSKFNNTDAEKTGAVVCVDANPLIEPCLICVLAR